MAEKDRLQYISDWQKENYHRLVVKFNRKSERDQRILNHLYEQRQEEDGDSIQEYIKKAMEEKMSR